MFSFLPADRNYSRYQRFTHRFSIALLFFVSLGVLATTHEIFSAVFSCLAGVLLLHVGLKRNSSLTLVSGIFLQGAGAYVFLDGAFYPFDALYFVNIYFYACLLIGAASLLSGYLIDQVNERFSVKGYLVTRVLIFWAICWFYYAGIREVLSHSVGVGTYNLLLLYFCAVSIVLTIIAEKTSWRRLALIQIVLLPASLACYLWGMSEIFGYYHLFGSRGWIAWLVAFFSLYRLLHHYEGAWPRWLAGSGHIGVLWLVVMVAGSEVVWLVDSFLGTPPIVAVLIRFGFPILIALLMVSLRNVQLWPVSAYRYYYLWGSILLPTVAIGLHELIMILR